VFEQLRDEHLIITDYHGAKDQRSIQAAVAEHFRFCQEIGLTQQKAVGAIIPKDSVTADSYRYSQFYTLVDPNEVAPTAGTEPIVDSGGTYIAIYDNKGYENVCELCNLLMDYGKKNHLWLDDSFYEDVVLDDFSVAGYYNYLVKVSIRVR
jgi:effector-binding domain-containing protein